ncbi:unnamed protein product [Spodoptera littoralis]|uniref:Uncharacterized protein n=1 Tax=Spodoptera littoralis TaxID=7109 RepID=A0A9P0IB18_SPOLI|nr:unnamed protein product [Spodoptera littoralis]CAH1642014.1 unnamed protein product [Spodoptera littoralis]
MESWDAVVTSYPDNPEPIDYAKAIRTANIIVDEDLAPFETEWLTKTLLFKPIRLFETIKSNTKRNDEAWVKYIADSIKLLSKLIETHWDVLENYNQELVELCSLSYDTQTRKEAILCLLKVVKQPSVALTDEFVVNVINAFEKTKTCKGPLAELVGALCRYFPEIVRAEGRCILIWRTYLNMFKNPREILAAEIKPRIASGSILVKHTALKVLMQASAGQAGGEMVLSSGENLEYQLRSKRVDYDEAATEGLDKYIDVWRSILDNNTGPDLDKAVMIFQETVHYILQDLVTTVGDQEKAIFSKEDNDYKVLIKILANLETVIEENSCNLDQRQLSLNQPPYSCHRVSLKN